MAGSVETTSSNGAAETPRPGGLFLVVRSGPVLWALPAAQVVETMRPLALRPAPSAPPFVLGMAMIRGEALPVVAMDAIAGVIMSGEHGRWVVLRTAQRWVALAVGAVQGVERLEGQILQEVPPLLTGTGGETLASLAALDRELLMVLQSGRLLPQQVVDAVKGLGDGAGG